MSFDMSKVKEGDKLVTRNGSVVKINYTWDGIYPYRLSNGTGVTKDGYYWADGTEDEFDIIGFADENQQANSVSEEMQANSVSEEMQAVELLLSLGYTLKKGV